MFIGYIDSDGYLYRNDTMTPVVLKVAGDKLHLKIPARVCIPLLLEKEKILFEMNNFSQLQLYTAWDAAPTGFSHLPACSGTIYLTSKRLIFLRPLMAADKHKLKRHVQELIAVIKELSGEKIEPLTEDIDPATMKKIFHLPLSEIVKLTFLETRELCYVDISSNMRKMRLVLPLVLGTKILAQTTPRVIEKKTQFLTGKKIYILKSDDEFNAEAQSTR